MSSLSIDYGYYTIDVIVTSYTPAVPATFGKLPEDSYPEEPAEIEFELVDPDAIHFIEDTGDYGEFTEAVLDEYVQRVGQNPEV